MIYLVCNQIHSVLSRFSRDFVPSCEDDRILSTFPFRLRQWALCVIVDEHERFLIVLEPENNKRKLLKRKLVETENLKNWFWNLQNYKEIEWAKSQIHAVFLFIYLNNKPSGIYLGQVFMGWNQRMAIKRGKNQAKTSVKQ